MSIESFEDIESRMKIIDAVVFQAWKNHDHDQFTDALLCSSHIFIQDLIHELGVLKNVFLLQRPLDVWRSM